MMTQRQSSAEPHLRHYNFKQKNLIFEGPTLLRLLVIEKVTESYE